MARDIETTIAALLAKAEGTTNAAEAEAYMAKAEKLMLQHGIERANLEAKGKPGSKREEIVTRRIIIPNGHGYADAMMHIGFAVAPAFSVKALKSNLRDGARMLWLVGHASDVEQAETLFGSLMAQSKPQAVAWWRSEGKASNPYASDNDAYMARREFIYAFASGVRERLTETRNRMVEEAEVGTALVLVDRAALVDSWIKDNIQFGKARSSNRNYGGADAARAGKQAGRDSVNSKALR